MTIFNNLSAATAGALLVALGTSGAAQAVTLVAPNELATVTGNSGSSLFYPDLARQQQVYGASQFSSLSGPQYINQISFRPIIGTQPFTANTPNVKISLSTISSSPDALSNTYSQNIGADNTLVFDGSALVKSLVTSTDTGPGARPNNFDINFNLSTPFLYDPSLGNLLLDISNNGGGGNFGVELDATYVIGDSVSTVASYLNATTATGGITTLGLATQFTTTAAVPTPPPTTPLPSPTTPEPPSMPPASPTEIPFEFSPGLGILLLGAWGGIAQLNSAMQKRKSESAP